MSERGCSQEGESHAVVNEGRVHQPGQRPRRREARLDALCPTQPGEGGLTRRKKIAKRKAAQPNGQHDGQDHHREDSPARRPESYHRHTQWPEVEQVRAHGGHHGGYGRLQPPPDKPPGASEVVQ